MLSKLFSQDTEFSNQIISKHFIAFFQEEKFIMFQIEYWVRNFNFQYDILNNHAII